ncbi:gluconate 5-dehydrogenase [Yersinia wautersii]|nr:gluconate 5-dehydrogenase [Yersinia wautersii]
MDVFMASLRSACSLRRGHFVNNLNSRVENTREFACSFP